MYLDDILAYEPRDEAEAGDKAMFLEYLRLFPDTILTRENKIAHLTASGFVVNGDGTRVLMAHHNLYRVWAWTGGHADGDGDLLSVALREAREETGVEHIKPLSTAIASLDILPVWDRRRPRPPPFPGGGEHQGGLAARRGPAGVHQRVGDGRYLYQAVEADKYIYKILTILLIIAGDYSRIRTKPKCAGALASFAPAKDDKPCEPAGQTA